VGKLRHKLAQALPQRQCIHMHFGFGYRFAPDGVSGDRRV
jgi:DNA-binding response OmpR family regulator